VCGLFGYSVKQKKVASGFFGLADVHIFVVGNFGFCGGIFACKDGEQAAAGFTDEALFCGPCKVFAVERATDEFCVMFCFCQVFLLLGFLGAI